MEEVEEELEREEPEESEREREERELEVERARLCRLLARLICFLMCLRRRRSWGWALKGRPEGGGGMVT